jgi:hypothetical protein
MTEVGAGGPSDGRSAPGRGGSPSHVPLGTRTAVPGCSCATPSTRTGPRDANDRDAAPVVHMLAGARAEGTRRGSRRGPLASEAPCGLGSDRRACESLEACSLGSRWGPTNGRRRSIATTRRARPPEDVYALALGNVRAEVVAGEHQDAVRHAATPHRRRACGSIQYWYHRSPRPAPDTAGSPRQRHAEHRRDDHGTPCPRPTPRRFRRDWFGPLGSSATARSGQVDPPISAPWYHFGTKCSVQDVQRVPRRGQDSLQIGGSDLPVGSPVQLLTGGLQVRVLPEE